jgi:dTDP-4-dehydrorhamnose 3,5-epimerase
MTDKFIRFFTKLQDVTLIKPILFRDARGFFLESYNKKEFEKIGITTDYIQDNHSCSDKGVVRGLHFQRKHPQEKLVRVISGSIYDVAVDLRKGSPQFGKSVGLYLSTKDMTMIHIPAGFAHGFLALEDTTHVLYKTSEPYYPEYDAGILWNDPDLCIPWPLEEFDIKNPLVSEKDKKLPCMKYIDSPFIYQGVS